ncbi:MAG: DUF2069 domain-containing protein [Burkholderiales bacterium]|nr:MAG: DUF2069 domain-containing protein [Burkholderiales bacterium]
MDPTALPRRIVVAAVAALILLSVAWELWLAPLKPGGSLMVLKALPLLAVLPSLMRGRMRAFQWWSMLILVYLCEGIVRGMSDPDATSRMLGWVETAIAGVAWFGILATVKAARSAAASQTSA